MNALDDSYKERLIELITDSSELMTVLGCVKSLSLRSWCIGAGAVRNLVWDTLHGQRSEFNSDVDVVFFDADSPPHRDTEFELQLCSMIPSIDWEVTNQAHIHLWFENAIGRAVRPLGSLEDGISTWPEYATCVGVYIADDDSIGIIAPHGLEDLFTLKVRHNPARATVEEFSERILRKRFRERWPHLAIVDA